MMPGPDQVIACPSCQGIAKYGTLMSGNTFGARVWTDGKQDAPMLPQPPAVVRCGHCHAFYWLEDAKKVGLMESWSEPAQDVPAAWQSAEEVQEPGESEYYEAIRAGLARNQEQERALRILAWWRSNDAFRDMGEAVVSADRLSEAERISNLQALLLLLNGNDDGILIMRAEALRELGMWQEAEEVLGHIRSDGYSDVASQIRALCRSQDACVREFKFDG